MHAHSCPIQNAAAAVASWWQTIIKNKAYLPIAWTIKADSTTINAILVPRQCQGGARRHGWQKLLEKKALPLLAPRGSMTDLFRDRTFGSHKPPKKV